MELDHTTTISRCWQITRLDEKQFLFTDHDKNIKFGGLIYLASSPLNMSTIEQNVGLDVDNFEVSGFFENDKILKKDIENGLFDQARIWCFEYDWFNEKVERSLFSGAFSNYSYADNNFSVEAHSQFNKLNCVFGRGFHQSCDAEFGDNRCGLKLDKLGYIHTPKIVEFDDFKLLTSDISVVPEGFFQGGIVEFIQDNLSTTKLLIRADKVVGNLRQFQFWKRLNETNRSAQNVRINLGCDKSIQCCSDRFGNSVNFRGFPNIPNDDWIKINHDN